MSGKTRKIPAPEVYPETQAFWDAAGRGQLLVKRCTDCGERHHYPRTFCPFCFGSRTEWTESAGTGSIYTYSVMRRAEVPYVIAYVTLDEGVTLMTNIVGCDIDAVRIGQRVKVVFVASDGGPPVAMFTPA